MNTVSLCVHDAHVKLNTFIKKNLYNLLAHQHIYSSSLFMRNQFFNSCSNTWETNPSVPWQRAGFTNLVIKIKAPELKKKQKQEQRGRTRATLGTYLSLPCPVPLRVPAPVHVPWHQSPIHDRPTPTDGCSRACFSSSPLYPVPTLPCFHVYAEVGLFLVPTKGLDY